MKDLFILYGHGEGDPGATGNGYQELERVKVLTGKVVKLLEDKGVSVLTNYGKDHNNYKKSMTEKTKYSCGCTIHLNSIGDNKIRGSEIIIPCKEKDFTIETEILSQLSKLGFSNRGVKSRDYNTESFMNRRHSTPLNYTDWYKEIRESWAKGQSHSIIEVCFISSKEDIALFNKEIDKIAKIIANAYLKYMKKTVYDLNQKEDKLYQVVAGTYSTQANAQKQVELLKAKGIESYIMVK
mgnify:CR=1 FL=1